GDLARCQLRLRRHLDFAVMTENAEEKTLFRLARCDRGTMFATLEQAGARVKAKAAARLRPRSVALVAPRRQQGPYPLLEVLQRGRVGRRCGRNRRGQPADQTAEGGELERGKPHDGDRLHGASAGGGGWRQQTRLHHIREGMSNVE